MFLKIVDLRPQYRTDSLISALLGTTHYADVNATRLDPGSFNSIIGKDVNTVIWNKIGQSEILHKRTSSILRRQVTVIGEQVSILFSFWLLFVQCYSKYHLL